MGSEGVVNGRREGEGKWGEDEEEVGCVVVTVARCRRKKKLEIALGKVHLWHALDGGKGHEHGHGTYERASKQASQQAMVPGRGTRGTLPEPELLAALALAWPMVALWSSPGVACCRLALAWPWLVELLARCWLSLSLAGFFYGNPRLLAGLAGLARRQLPCLHSVHCKEFRLGRRGCRLLRVCL